jgi:peptidylprolyl isomerase
MSIKVFAAFFLLMLLPLSACGENKTTTQDSDGGIMQWDSPPEMTIDADTEYLVTIETSHGTMKGRLFPDIAPIAVNNFVFLAKQGYFDGLIVHRIVKGFVLQSGDPTGTGTGGPGYQIQDDPVPDDRNYLKGSFAMANKGVPGTGGSQFFITLDDLTGRLPKQYALFGLVEEGLDVVDAINDVETEVGSSGENSKPTEDVRIISITIEEK